jgi:adenine-specific DNA-methyltransferase
VCVRYSDGVRQEKKGGDNLEVLKLLQKSYHKKVKMVYIDPPYNTSRDFGIYDLYDD